LIMPAPQRLHILGICGTFMAGLALLAREAGFAVTGSDQNVYPPMSTQLEAAGITVLEGYRAEYLQDSPPDLVIIGNAMTRGNPAVEYVLDSGLAYTSGPQWLAEHILPQRWVLAVAGTHGKTSVSSMLAWILETAGLHPGFLIGGLPLDLGCSARLGQSPFFVVEADEYDSAFFDKRSKFIHYRPRTLVLNNLEYDHADIFPDLAAIQRQFHHLVRTVPHAALIVCNGADRPLKAVLEQGCWTPVETLVQGDWTIGAASPDYQRFEIILQGQSQGHLDWSLLGQHNAHNALAAIAAARHAGVPIALSLEALQSFQGVKRRLELRGEVNKVRVYDDFAHHPTAIATTLNGLRRSVGEARILAVLEPRSNTMKLGVFADALAQSLSEADAVYLYQPPDQTWRPPELTNGPALTQYHDVGQLVQDLSTTARPGDHILVMSNGGFENIHQRLLEQLQARGQE
jgi:UDP-N-acetylmuramate: L-alanyl-gamma-D-glutamyl-meso-diaminopimelate ligase